MKSTFTKMALAAMLFATVTSCKKDLSGEDPSLTSDASTVINTQSAQVNMAGVHSDYQVVGTQTWSYDYSNRPDAIAAFDTYFTLVQTGTATALEIDGFKHKAMTSTGGQNAIVNRCNFW